MSGNTNIDRRSVRRQETIDEIVDAAWALSRSHGLGNFSMRELGARVGMRAQSLYSYFASKNEIFDAMFLQGNLTLLERYRAADVDTRDPVAVANSMMQQFVEFSLGDPVRYQLLFQRTIPDFEPSDEAYEVARQAYDEGTAPLVEIGVDQAGLDLATAVATGIVSQQLSNDPGGDRWQQLVPRAAAMLIREIAPHLLTHEPTGSRS